MVMHLLQNYWDSDRDCKIPVQPAIKALKALKKSWAMCIHIEDNFYLYTEVTKVFYYNDKEDIEYITGKLLL